MQKLRSLLVGSGAIVGPTDVSDAPRVGLPKDTEGEATAFTADTHLCMVGLQIAGIARSIVAVDHPSSEHLASVDLPTRELASQLCPWTPYM